LLQGVLYELRIGCMCVVLLNYVQLFPRGHWPVIPTCDRLSGLFV